MSSTPLQAALQKLSWSSDPAHQRRETIPPCYDYGTCLAVLSPEESRAVLEHIEGKVRSACDLSDDGSGTVHTSACDSGGRCDLEDRIDTGIVVSDRTDGMSAGLSPEESRAVLEHIGLDGYAECECGDYRKDHPDEGQCVMNELGHGTVPDQKCNRYRPMRPKKLTFRQLRDANVARLPLFKDRRGRYCHRRPDGQPVGFDWALSQWANAVLGELGEAANIIKKIERGDFTLEEAREELGRELADVQTYLDLLAHRAGVELDASTIQKWNEVSERIGCDLRLKA